jgi:hypothetical protein
MVGAAGSLLEVSTDEDTGAAELLADDVGVLVPPQPAKPNVSVAAATVINKDFFKLCFIFGLLSKMIVLGLLQPENMSRIISSGEKALISIEIF